MILLIFISIVYCETVCNIPIIFHKFENCPDTSESDDGVLRAIPYNPFERLCPNEGSCMNTGFYAFRTDTDEETFVSGGTEYEGFCSCDIKTAELLVKHDQHIIVFWIHNILSVIDPTHTTYSLYDGITTVNPITMYDAFEEQDRLHVFLTFDYDEETGFMDITVYINKELVHIFTNLLYTTTSNIILSNHTDDPEVFNERYYHFALFDHLLDVPTIESYTDIGINREVSDEFCFEVEDTVSVQGIRMAKRGLHNLIWILPSIIVGILLVVIVASILLTVITTVVK